MDDSSDVASPPWVETKHQKETKQDGTPSYTM